MRLSLFACDEDRRGSATFGHCRKRVECVATREVGSRTSGEFLRGFKAFKVVRLQNRITPSRFGFDFAILHDFANLNGLSDHHVVAVAVAIAETTHERQERWYDR